MQSYRSYIWGIIFGLILTVNPLILTSVQAAADSDTLYLNKIAIVNFDIGYKIDIVDNIAYICSNNGIEIINIENPKRPKKINRIILADGAFDFKIRNDTIFIAADSEGLVIANISNPSEPVIKATYSGLGSAYSIEMKDNYCYLGYVNGETDILNITNLAQPTYVKELVAFPFNALEVRNDLMFCVSQALGLYILNVTDPVNPTTVNSMGSLIGAQTITIKENILYLGCHMYGIKAIDITDPENIFLVNSADQDDDGEAIGIDYSGDYLGVADFKGVEVFNISTSSTLTKLCEYRQGISSAHDLKVVGNFVYSGILQGLGIFEISNTKKAYFPLYLYYVLPIVVVVMGVLSIFITRRRKMKVEH